MQQVEQNDLPQKKKVIFKKKQIISTKYTKGRKQGSAIDPVPICPVTDKKQNKTKNNLNCTKNIAANGEKKRILHIQIILIV